MHYTVERTMVSQHDVYELILFTRAGFYAENLLLYNKEAQSTGKLPLPIGNSHKFAPVALGDIAHIAAAVITSEGPHGLSDQFRGQMIVATGPMSVYHALRYV